MPAQRHFKAWNEARTRKHIIHSANQFPQPCVITEHRLDKDEFKDAAAWCQPDTVTKPRLLRKMLSRKVHPNMRPDCRLCKVPVSDEDAQCEANCYAEFKRIHFRSTTQRLIEIRQTENMGYGVFVQPGKRITKGQYLGEYLGQLRPDTVENSNIYSFEGVAGVYDIDARKYGNWTRFVNHHCEPNISVRISTIGRRNMVLFLADRNIKENEQLFIHYGSDYFSDSDLKCCCDAEPKPHLPVT